MYMFRLHGLEAEMDVMTGFQNITFGNGESVISFIGRIEMFCRTRSDFFNEAIMRDKLLR